MATPKKAYKGLAMEGPIARWYATITAHDRAGSQRWHRP